ncbi:MAG: nitroreductase family deazaflavin-dependent oxidoreductase [Chloroflexota bacterium]
MASAPPNLFFKLMTRTHTFLYRLSGGKIGKSMQGMPVLLLTTIGRKSGQPRTASLLYLRDGDDYLITASKGGAASHPAWYFNLEATSEVEIQVGDQAFTARVTITEDEERDQLYERFKSSSNEYAKYEQMTQRTIPVVRLTPV